MPLIALPVVLLVFMFLSGLLAGFIVLLVKGSPRTRRNLLIGGGVAVVVLGGLLVLGFLDLPAGVRDKSTHVIHHVERDAAERAAARVAEPPAAAEAAAAGGGGSATALAGRREIAWSPAAEGEFTADLYPSLKQAAEALAKEIDAELARALRDRSENREFQGVIVASASSGDEARDEARRSAVARVAESLDRARDEVQVRAADELLSHLAAVPEDAGSDGELILVLIHLPESKAGTTRPWGQETGVTSGKLRAQVKRLRHGSGTSYRQVEVRFSEKPWLTRESEFFGRHPDRPWAVVKTSGFADSAGEVRNRIAHDAAGRHRWRLLSRVDQIAPWLREQEGMLHQAFYNDLASGRYQLDELTQQLTFSHGSVYRGAALLDFSPARLDATIHRVIPRARAESSRAYETWLGLVWRIASAAAMVGVIALLYVVLNAVTKGYYQGLLRWGGVAVVVAAGVLLLLLA
ncbi:MAG: hypothetical protein ACLFV3_11295 [Phycisphaeraceae bacterium]